MATGAHSRYVDPIQRVAAAGSYDPTHASTIRTGGGPVGDSPRCWSTCRIESRSVTAAMNASRRSHRGHASASTRWMRRNNSAQSIRCMRRRSGARGVPSPDEAREELDRVITRCE